MSKPVSVWKRVNVGHSAKRVIKCECSTFVSIFGGRGDSHLAFHSVRELSIVNRDS